jgi:hypothetical protein
VLHEAFGSAGEAAPWSPLSPDAAAATDYVGPREIELYRSDTGNYRHNRAVAVALDRAAPIGDEPPF